jgi:hypothetical protein
MAQKMKGYAKGVNKPIPRTGRVGGSSALPDLPPPGKSDKMRRIPLARKGKR